MHIYISILHHPLLHIFFFNDPATTEIYTLSLHDALPILGCEHPVIPARLPEEARLDLAAVERELLPELRANGQVPLLDRKSTRLNSSHSQISYAVFCLKKKKIN